MKLIADEVTLFAVVPAPLQLHMDSLVFAYPVLLSYERDTYLLVREQSLGVRAQGQAFSGCL